MCELKIKIQKWQTLMVYNRTILVGIELVVDKQTWEKEVIDQATHIIVIIKHTYTHNLHPLNGRVRAFE